jgi:uncharacterized protein (TIGR03085 family)
VDDRGLQRQERGALCDTLQGVGANAPTMCEGWRAIDLASHVVVRERDPWTAPVILCGRMTSMVERMTARERLTGYDRVLQRLRGGPPWLFRSTPQVVRLNLVEDWIHHEDVRRANGLEPRTSSYELDEVLWRGIGGVGKVAGMRLDDVGLDAVAPDGRGRAIKSGRQVVEVVGPPGEILLYLTGRSDVARVELRGPADAVDRVRASPLRL